MNRNIRPHGFDFTVADPEECRCQVCNRDGKNRSGMVFAGYVGLSTTTAYGYPCGNCFNGIKPEYAQELGV